MFRGFQSYNCCRPGQPTENARVERFNGSFRRELLDCYVFSSLKEVRDHVEEWIYDYNHHRPHEALNDLTPIQFLERYNQDQEKSA
jgi:putative transposase